VKKYRLALYIVVIFLLVLLLAYAGLSAVVYTSVGRFPTKGAKYPTPQIRSLIWPTIGYPALVAPGGLIDAEVDLTGGAQAERTSGWQAIIRPARKALSNLVYRLSPRRAWRSASSRWPRGTRFGSSRGIWHVELEIPAEAVPELYDLTIEADTSIGHISDGQRHAVSVIDGPKKDLTFISLADIHVHERGLSGFAQKQTDKGISPDGRPIFFEKAIEQVNLIRPDFVVVLGDNVRGQKNPGEYQKEFEWFFKELARFEVPTFLVPGNHDLYVNQVDGLRVWQENIGPPWYSFDIGDSHFTCVNTYEWPYADRIVMKKLGLFVYPHKWQGEILEAKDEKDVSTYSGQLAWIRDDLAAHQNSPLRLMLLHHDPYRPNGEGIAFDNERFAGIFSLGGRGKGRTALKELASRYRVQMVLSGHIHSDYVGHAPWSDGKGETVYANQTCVYFDEGGMADKYPGYRLVKVQGGRVTDFTYLDGFHSMPLYDGSVVKGETDLDHLERPALAAAGGGSSLRWEVASYLGVPVELRGLIVTAPGSSAYSALGGEVYRTVKIPGDNQVLLYVRTPVPKGTPGKSATKPGNPARVEVKAFTQTP
jgi:3',5'-cyclic AMP phosphodiesterase CpdA